LALIDRPTFSEFQPNMSSGRGRLPGGSSHLNVDLQAHLAGATTTLTEGRPRKGKGSHEKKADRSSA
jgi:hypothetical protein